MLNVLLVEDDSVIASLLQTFLQTTYHVTHVTHPSEALLQLQHTQYAIIILDLTLPEMDGLALCTQLRKCSKAGIIISSARSGIDDKLTALKEGADDYLPKPYDPRELLARMEVIIKRLGVIAEQTFIIQQEQGVILYQNEPLTLTFAEFEIFALLLNHPNQILSRSDIANSISAHRFESTPESINVLIAKLRKKLPVNTIETIRGMGYKYATH